MAEWLIGAANRLLKSIRSYTSALSFSSQTTFATTKRFLTASTSGVLTFTGALFKGWLYGTVRRILSMFRTTTGVLNMTGEHIQNLGQYFSVKRESFVHFAGVVSTFTANIASKGGIISAGSGIVSKVISVLRTYPGALNLSGIVQRTIGTVAKSYGGTISFASNTYKAIVRVAYPGVLSFTSGLTWLVNYLVVAALTTAGEASRLLNLFRTYSSSLSFSSVVDGVFGVTQFFYTVTKTGALTFTKTLLASQGLYVGPYTGALTVIGRITIIDAILNRFDGAAITPSGILNRLWETARDKRTGSILMSGILTASLRQTKNTYTSALSFVSDLTVSLPGEWHSYPDGDLTFAGVYTRLIDVTKTYISELDLAGTISRLINAFRTKDGGLSFAGVVSVVGFVESDWRLGNLSFAGNYLRTIFTGIPARGGNLVLAGALSRSVSVARTPAGVLEFAGEFKKIREFLYLGPPNP